MSKEIDDLTTESFESGFLRRRNISCGRQMVKIIITEKSDMSSLKKVKDAFFDHLNKNFFLTFLFYYFLTLIPLFFVGMIINIVYYLFFGDLRS
jgi:hypothetical protein